MQRGKLLCVLAAGLLAAFAAQSQTITNPGYEDDATGWTITVSDGDFGPFFENIAAQSHSGTECLKFWSDTEHTGSAEQTLTGVPEGRYLVSAWAFGYASTTMTISADGGYGVESVVYNLCEPSGNYINIGVPVRVNSAGNLNIKFEHTSEASINLQLDDWEITPIGSELIANPSFEFNSHGSFAGWEVAFDASTTSPFIEQDGAADPPRGTLGSYGMRLGNKSAGASNVLAGTISQIIRDVPAGDYTVSFDVGSWWDGDYSVQLDLNGNAGTPVAVTHTSSSPIYNYTPTENITLAEAGDLEIVINFSSTTTMSQWAAIWFDNVVLEGGGGATVPDVSDMTQAEATTALEDAGYVVSVEQEASDTVPAGTIIRTEPAIGSALAAGETVTLVVSTGSASSDLPVAGLLGIVLLGGSCVGTGVSLLRKRMGR